MNRRRVDGYNSVCRECAKKIPCKVTGTLSCFKTRTWSNINKRTVNGYSAHNANDRDRSYINRGTLLSMTREELYDFCDENEAKIMSMYAEGKTPSINRKDPKGDYSTENLEITDMIANSKEGAAISKEIQRRPVTAVNLKTGLSTYHISISDAARDLSSLCSREGVRDCCNGRQKTHAGYTFRFTPKD